MEKEFNKILEPPSGLELAGILTLGYSGEQHKPIKRKSLEELLKIT